MHKRNALDQGIQLMRPEPEQQKAHKSSRQLGQIVACHLLRAVPRKHMGNLMCKHELCTCKKEVGCEMSGGVITMLHKSIKS